MRTARRDFLAGAMVGLTGLAGAAPAAAAAPPPAEDVSAPEDLMREHGVLRRILLIYETALHRMGLTPGKVPAEVFFQSATLIRKFVEDYHEKLEENFIFPLYERRGELLPLVATLRKQHQAGRQLTVTVLRSATADQFPKEEPRRQIIHACKAFIRMYRPHAAREDTVLFPALHKLMTAAEMDKLGDRFEDEENRLFGKEGFEHIVAQVAGIEKQLGILDLDQFTPSASSRQ
jgi:hemerythrin-like domain-containing protein